MTENLKSMQSEQSLSLSPRSTPKHCTIRVKCLEIESLLYFCIPDQRSLSKTAVTTKRLTNLLELEGLQDLNPYKCEKPSKHSTFQNI